MNSEFRINNILRPIGWLYGLVTAIRNRLYDSGIRKSQEFPLPVISIGNITVGGTGKTPHAEYTATLLKDRYKTAVLSRGYGRHTKLDEDRSIAVIPIGYADGFDRRFSNYGGEVWVRGKRCPVVGNVCMDQAMIDVTEADARPGDIVEVFGEKMPLQELADKLGTITYEILTSVSRRVQRIYFYE